MPRRSRVQRHGRLEVECCITIIHSYVRICEEARVEKPSEGRQTQRERGGAGVPAQSEREGGRAARAGFGVGFGFGHMYM